MDMEAIVKAARTIKPDIYIISDAVQHAPHMAWMWKHWALMQ